MIGKERDSEKDIFDSVGTVRAVVVRGCEKGGYEKALQMRNHIRADRTAPPDVLMEARLLSGATVPLFCFPARTVGLGRLTSLARRLSLSKNSKKPTAASCSTFQNSALR